MLIFITAVAVVLIVSFLCSVFESVLLSITRPQVEMLSRDGRHAGELLAGFKEHMDVPIAAILILNTAAHTIGAAVAGASYADVFDPKTLWIFSLVFTFAVLLFTEIIPKTLGVNYTMLLAGPVAYGIRVLTVALKPLVVVTELISRSLRNDQANPVTSPEELRLLASLGRSEGAVSAGTAGMIVGATHLRHLEAHDIMLPRDQIQFLSGTMNRDAVIKQVRETGHSRFPFTPTDSIDDVSGVVLVKTLLDWLLHNPDVPPDWAALSKDTLIMPYTAPLPKMLRTFQESRRHMAVVVDEYGSVQGIATLEDLLEEIVGDIRDESDQPADDIRPQPDGSLHVRASVDLRQLSATLGVAWDPDTDIITIGGLVTEMLQRIPVAGDTIEWNGYRIEVLEANRRRARLVAIKRIHAQG
jgi:CBS domain containing-hemolysin-like protein